MRAATGELRTLQPRQVQSDNLIWPALRCPDLAPQQCPSWFHQMSLHRIDGGSAIRGPRNRAKNYR